jgi:hypothetical protein
MSEPQGWICPRCNRVNAPWVSKCDCYPGSVQETIQIPTLEPFRFDQPSTVGDPIPPPPIVISHDGISHLV